MTFKENEVQSILKADRLSRETGATHYVWQDLETGEFLISRFNDRPISRLVEKIYTADMSRI